MTDEFPIHVVKTGKLVVNLQSLEFALRAFLYNDEIGCQKDFEPPSFLENIKEGDLVPENAFTNYDNLRNLIEKFNEKVREHDSGLCVDEDLVDIRDALAHGRIASKSPSANEPNKLVKYDKPKDGSVQVTHCVIMDEKWFKEQIHLVHQNIVKVSKANEMLSVWQPKAQRPA